MRTHGSSIPRYAGYFVAAAAVAACWYFLAPSRLGGRVDYAVVYGVSMQPHLRAGDLAVLRAGSGYAVGDVVGYRNGELHRVVLHRIVGRRGGRYLMKGDNNDFVDSYHPSRQEVIGRLWVRVPAVGTAVAWLRPPLHEVVVLAVLALLALGGGGARVRRPRRRRPGRMWAVLPPDAAAGADEGASKLRIVRVDDPPKRRVPWPPAEGRAGRMLAAAAFVLACSAFAAVLGFGNPTSRRTALAGAYVQRGAYSYSARAAKGTVYPSGRVDTGQPVFTRLVRRLRLGFSYRFASRLPHTVEGTARLQATLASSLGWSTRLATAPGRSFQGGGVRITDVVDLAAAEREMASYLHRTGLSSDTFTVVVQPRVRVTGRVSGARVATAFAPSPLTFSLDPISLRLQQPAASGELPGEAAPDPLHPVASGAVEQTAQNTLSVLGAAVPVTTLRLLAGAGLLVSLALGLLGAAAAAFTRGEGDEVTRILRRFGDAIVPVAGPPPGAATRPVDVVSFESLLQLADRYDRVILHARSRGADVFYVDDERAVYRYRPGSAPEDAHGDEPVRRTALLRT